MTAGEIRDHGWADMKTVILAALAINFVMTSVAHAAPVLLPDAAQARLDAGERIRVIVWFAGPEFTGPDIAQSLPRGTDQDARIAQIDALRDETILRALGVPAAMLAAAPQDINGPRLAREFRYSPGAAMVLSAREIAALAADPGVRRIEIDALSSPGLDESVPLIGATAMHTDGQTGQGVSVAILDTGVDLQHPMFAGRIAGSACFSSSQAGRSTSFCPGGEATNTTDPQAGDNCEERSIDDVNGGTGCFHGTHVAGIAVGGDFVDPGNAARTLRGVAPGAGVVAVQVFSQFTGEDDCGDDPTPCVRSFTSDQNAALEWLHDNRVALNLASINMSLGGGQTVSACTGHAHVTIIGQLRAAGIATAIAAGNDGFRDSVGSPACIPDAITVGSTTKTDTVSSFSNSNGLVDVLAPGSSIRSALPSPNDSGTGGATTASGTSMAAPHVAGALALLRAAHPAASIDAIESALEATGVPITLSANNVTTPRIRVDLASAQLTANNGGVLGSLTVSPLRAFNSTGLPGDASSFSTADYTLTNTGGSALTWSVSSAASFLAFAEVAGSGGTPAVPADSASGNLAAGASTIVRVSVNPEGLNGGTALSRFAFIVSGTQGSVEIAASVSVSDPPPANDNFANAFRLSAVSTVTAFNSVGATKESGEPNHAASGGASVWWSWTSPVDGTARIRTQGADFDTMLAVYTGNEVNVLTQIAQNDDIDFPSDTQSQVEFPVSAGTVYRIAVDGFGGAAGNAELSIRFVNTPANDAVASATVISGANGAITSSNVNATKAGGEPAHGGGAGGASVWFSWTSPSSGTAVFDPAGSSFATLIGVYTSSDGGTTLNSVASANGAPAAFTAVQDTNYLIAIDGADGATGLVAISWTLGTAETHRLRAAVLPNARSVTVGQSATAFATLINPAGFGAGGTNCRLEPPPGFNGGFTYRTTDPATNQPTGTDDTPVPIASGASRSFVFALTPGTPLNGAVLAPVFRCDDVLATSAIPGVTTLTLTASAGQTADVITVAATASGNGIVNVPLDAATAFSVAAVNIGTAESVTVTPGFGGAALPLTLEICETNPATGQCLAARASTATLNFEANETRTFSVFVRGTGTAVASAPATNRVVVSFTNSADTAVGATSAAVQTRP
ncbi:MAG: S8 family serine peptidase [Alphaproteobacteria bacterium]|nr:S8 family serine peptidase [Alphaproteobacteria bacterium]